jgi:hypothetical protein
MATVTIHAPCVNLAWMTSTATSPVAIAPAPLTAARRCQPGSRRSAQYRTIPACESVNATKTPIT